MTRVWRLRAAATIAVPGRDVAAHRHPDWPTASRASTSGTRRPSSTSRRLVPVLGLAVWLASPAAAQNAGELQRGASGGRLTPDAVASLLEQAKTAAFEVGMQSEPAPRQRSLTRMMTGLGLAVAGGRLVWYRFEDKDCREPEGARCAWVAGAGVAGLGVGVLLLTVLSSTPAARSVHFEPQPGGLGVRVDLLGSSSARR